MAKHQRSSPSSSGENEDVDEDEEGDTGLMGWNMARLSMVRLRPLANVPILFNPSRAQVVLLLCAARRGGRWLVERGWLRALSALEWRKWLAVRL